MEKYRPDTIAEPLRCGGKGCGIEEGKHRMMLRECYMDDTTWVKQVPKAQGKTVHRFTVRGGRSNDPDTQPMHDNQVKLY